MMTDESKPPFPPFDSETAVKKVRLAEDAWDTRDPERVSLAYTSDSQWRRNGLPNSSSTSSTSWRRSPSGRTTRSLRCVTFTGTIRG